MPRVTHVKKAAKDNPVAKAGESYYWWKFRWGGKHYSKTPPRQSQLTQSDFLGAVYSLQEDIEDWEDESIENLVEAVENWKGQIECIRDETQDKLDNMPEAPTTRTNRRTFGRTYKCRG